MSQKVRKAVFPVGGLGTRFLPATKAMPKEMLPVVDKPLIQYAVEEAREAGIEEFIFVTGRGKTIIEDHFDRSYELESVLNERSKEGLLAELHASVADAGTVAYIRQQEALGLGHAVWCAKRLVGNEPFAVILADDLILADTPCLAQMTAAREKAGGGNMLAVMEVPNAHTSRYGILSPGKEDGNLVEILGLVEKPEPAKAPSNLAVIGRYILEPKVFDILENQSRGAGNEIQLTDALSSLLGHDPFFGMKFDGTRFDCGDKIGFLEANIAFALNREDMRDDVKNFISKFARDF
ncbi:UTP--glucose-1-phosphate uridylyltransferase GalU [Sneathiella sp.]|uniref:UTP--glucose-1-phosphate uridylyltransferase GalU n=1 Tax=Sneathiella sp. TaxID=1964365 RepID=UPI003561C31C